MRRITIALLLLCPIWALATTVTGVVRDPAGIPYANGTITVALISPGGVTPIVTATGANVISPGPGTLGSDGSVSLTLADNTTITPASTQWQFTVCSAVGTVPIAIGRGSQCFSVSITISGGSQNITTTLQNAAPSLTGIGTVAKLDLTAQSANVSNIPLYVVPANSGGTFRMSCYVVVTQAASTSSTMPACSVTFTENDTGAAAGEAFTVTDTGNIVGRRSSNAGSIGQNSGIDVIEARAGTAIGFQTASYASVGGTPMQFAVHVKLEYLGP